MYRTKVYNRHASSNLRKVEKRKQYFLLSRGKYNVFIKITVLSDNLHYSKAASFRVSRMKHYLDNKNNIS